jgi:hypothetical protein
MTTQAPIDSSTPNLPMNVAEQLAKQLTTMAKKVETVGGNTIRVTQDKKFVMPDGKEGAGPISAVILDWAYTNTYFPGKFDRNNPTPPACFAISQEPKGMVPSENSPDVQSNGCDACPMNQFGSRDEGKACKNSVKIALGMPGVTEDTVHTIIVSPTARKYFAKYVNDLRVKNVHPMQVITEIFFDAGSSYASLRFAVAGPNPNVDASFGQQKKATEMVLAEPDVSGYEEAVKRAQAGKKGKK